MEDWLDTKEKLEGIYMKKGHKILKEINANSYKDYISVISPIYKQKAMK